MSTPEYLQPYVYKRGWGWHWVIPTGLRHGSGWRPTKKRAIAKIHHEHEVELAWEAKDRAAHDTVERIRF